MEYIQRDTTSTGLTFGKSNAFPKSQHAFSLNLGQLFTRIHEYIQINNDNSIYIIQIYVQKLQFLSLW